MGRVAPGAWPAWRHGRAVANADMAVAAGHHAQRLLSHLYMDWQGSYGWRPFLPWSGSGTTWTGSVS